MPNWCMNSLEVEGPAKVLGAWVKAIEVNKASETGLFGTFVVPEYNEDESNWWVAHNNAWATKWDVEISKLDWEKYVDGVKLRFDTAWSPPIAWLETMSVNWPTLVFKMAFEETGMDFMGYVIYKNGDEWMVDDECPEWEYSEDQALQAELDEAYADAMNERRDQLMHEASDAYEKAMYV
jgi:hypothetical protein